MTAASELKSAAVVEGEVKAKRKTSETRIVENAVSKTVVKNAGVVSFKSGSTTAAATKKVASLQVVKETSGSRAATTFRAASIRATRLPVSIFPKNSRLSATNQESSTPSGDVRWMGNFAQVAQTT